MTAARQSIALTIESVFNRRENKGIAAVLCSALIKGCVSTYVMTLFSLHMELSGVPTRIIGLANSSQLVATVLIAISLPKFLYRINLFHMQAVAGILGMAGIFGLMLYGDQTLSHLAFRLILGCGLTSSYVVYEYWLNSASVDALRGRVMALYGTCVVIGMGVGPLLIPMVGTEGFLPYLIGIILFFISFLPILIARHHAPKLHAESPSTGLWGIIRLSPIIAVAGMMYGVTESSMMGFLPIYGLREGLTETNSALMLSLIFWGGVVLQLPIGWMADKISAGYTLLAAAGIGIIGGIILPFLIGAGAGVHLWLHMLIWGGVVTTIYTIATVLIGAEHKGANLANATLAYGMMYGTGSMLGPTITSEALERIGTQGLPWVMAFTCGITFTFALWHTWRKKHA